ncbi:MAG: ribosome-binding factor A [Massilioclostridium sp.]|nr:ribosome-binding factor A [Massilioclostridium sp.]
MEGLKSASGFVKRELSNTLHMRKCPDIKFIPDDSIEYSAHLNKLLLDIETE